jgi:peptide-methionine (R)-S-oxide reductase
LQKWEINRRNLLAGFGSSFALLGLTGCGSSPARAGSFPVEFSESEWRTRLTDEQYYILREAGTERRYTSPLNEEKRDGTYHCAGCQILLYSSETKYESGTGWPAFWRAEPESVATSIDYKLGFPRTEVHCANCGGHLGHIFSDGPPPTGKRHCINGLAMEFKPSNLS